MEHFCLTGYFTLWLAAVDALKKCDADARKNAYQRIKSLLTDDFLTSGSALQMPMVLGMGMELPEKQDEKKPYILLKYAEQKYPVSLGDTPAGNARRVINALKDFQKLADQDKSTWTRCFPEKRSFRALCGHRIIPIRINWRPAKKRSAGFASRSPCVRSAEPSRISTMCACSGILWPVFAPRHLVL